MRIKKLISIISLILFIIFLIIGVDTNNHIFGGLSLLSIISFFYFIIVDLNDQIDEECEKFMDKYYIHQGSDSDEQR